MLEGPGIAPIRTCIGCRKRSSIEGLVRVARLEGGSLVVGRTAPGRGAWLCRNSPNCIDLAVKRQAFERALRGRVEKAQMDQIRIALGTGPEGKTGQGSAGRAL
jgi:uncharacterized protein